jgi:ActR/RegA family two-component response regulator
MSNKVIFILGDDKDFTNLYSRLLQTKGWQVFATDNIFLLINYAKTAKPRWVFIDENFAKQQEKNIAKLINNAIPFNATNYAIMSQHIEHKNRTDVEGIEFIYKPNFLQKVIQIS